MACDRRARQRGAKASFYPSEHPVRFVFFTRRQVSWLADIRCSICLPTVTRSGPTLSRRENGQQSAYSCGGSHGLGPFWVFRTVFPINPLGVIRWGNRHLLA